MRVHNALKICLPVFNHPRKSRCVYCGLVFVVLCQRNICVFIVKAFVYAGFVHFVVCYTFFCQLTRGPYFCLFEIKPEPFPLASRVPNVGRVLSSFNEMTQVLFLSLLFFIYNICSALCQKWISQLFQKQDSKLFQKYISEFFFKSTSLSCFSKVHLWVVFNTAIPLLIRSEIAVFFSQFLRSGKPMEGQQYYASKGK